jgi:NAD(P)-dependent dehydrogenase (short-subunit alcohol dehydrogenase family)
MADRYSIAGKTALVTGAAKGIGFETAKLLHQRGASVAILDLDLVDAQAAAETIGERTLALDVDVTDTRAMELATKEIVERFGGLDIVVANAGIAPQPRPMSVMGNEVFERVIDVDLYGVWRTVRPALPQVIERQGHVVVVASVYAFLNGMLAAPYAMSKAGVEALGRALRVELAPHGASAGVAYFGFIDTDMVRDTFADPIAQRVEEAFPNWLTKRITPDIAGATIVNGIERRAPRMIAPRWWAAWSALRGVVNPLFDRAARRDEGIAEAVREGERNPPG